MRNTLLELAREYESGEGKGMLYYVFGVNEYGAAL
jgi:hypothetical protein